MDEITTDSDGYDYDVVNFDKQTSIDFMLYCALDASCLNIMHEHHVLLWIGYKNV